MDDSISVISVEAQPDYVIGMPVHVAVTVQASPDTSFNELIFADVFGLNESIGIEVYQQGSANPIARYSPKPILEPEIGVYGDELAAGQARRMLIDISPLLTALQQPGAYIVRLSYVTPDEAYPAQAVELRLRAATAEELSMLASVAGERSQYANWIDWTLAKPSTDQLPDSVSPGNPLRFNLLLRKMIYGYEELRRIDPLTFQVLDGVYAPEAGALKAEVLLARSDEAAYRQVKAETLNRTSGLAWWFQNLDAGGAYIGALRFSVHR